MYVVHTAQPLGGTFCVLLVPSHVCIRKIIKFKTCAKTIISHLSAISPTFFSFSFYQGRQLNTKSEFLEYFSSVLKGKFFSHLFQSASSI